MARTTRTTVGAVALLVGLITSFAGVLPGRAAAGAGAGPEPVSEYAGWPADRHEGCGEAEIDATYDLERVVGAPQLAVDLADLVPAPAPGDLLTMSWVPTGPCSEVGMSLSQRRADGPEPDPGDDRELVDGAWASCGPAGADGGCIPGPDGRVVLSIVVAPRADACDSQIEAALGLPLAVAGPSGSFPDAATRGTSPHLGRVDGPDLLLSRTAGDAGPCGTAEPSVTPALSCPAGGLELSMANPGELGATILVLADGAQVGDPVELAAGWEPVVVVPLDEDVPTEIRVLADGVDLVDARTWVLDCTPADAATAPAAEATTAPSADEPAEPSEPGELPVAQAPAAPPEVRNVDLACAEGGVGVEVANPGAASVTFTFFKNGALVGSPVAVPAGGTTTAVVPFAEDETATITVVAEGTEIFRTVATRDCVPVEVVVDVACGPVSASVRITLTSTESAPGPVRSYAVLEDGVVVGAVDLPAGQATTREYPIGAGERAEYAVLDVAGTVVGTSSVSNPCQAAAAPTVVARSTPAAAAPLARTGSESRALSAVGGLLLLVGGSTLAFSGRQERLAVRS